MTSPEEFLNIDTPENVAFDYEIVGIGSRFLAALIDTLIIAIIQAFVYLVILAILGFDLDITSPNFSLIIGLLTFLSFLMLWGYYIFFEIAWNGRTPGKKAVGLRTIRQDGTPITVTESIIRNLIRFIDFIPMGYGVGVITMFIDSKSRRLGDLAAGTIVVRDLEEVTLESLKPATRRPQQLRAPGPAETTARTYPIHLLDESDIRMAESFLNRHLELRNSKQLAYKISQRLMRKMGLDSTQAVFASDSIHVIATIVREWHGKQIG
ncbi:MAG: RDD family protein [Chloroflexi bacterium]|nr:RDD family protein [Chloroflexota bacterium]